MSMQDKNQITLKTDEPHEVIIEVGAEGGSLTIFGKRNAIGDWSFFSEKNEIALADLLTEEDRGGSTAFERSDDVNSFDEALKLLEPYSWFHFNPRKIHPDFLDRVLLEVKKRGGESEFKRWSWSLSLFRS